MKSNFENKFGVNLKGRQYDSRQWGGQGSESRSMKNSIVGREKRRQREGQRMAMGNGNCSKARV